MSESSKSRRLVCWIASVAVFIAISIVGLLAYVVWTTSTAEMNFHAMRQAVIATQIFVQDNDGQWPKSWEDLKRNAPEDFDLDWAAQHVAFDFNADPDALSKQRWDTFTGIRPSRPCYSAYDNELTHLIETLSNR